MSGSNNTFVKTALVQDAVLLDASGDQGVYWGTVSVEQNLPHTTTTASVGEFQYDDGRTYKGGFRMGRWHGNNCSVKFPNGDTYQGDYSLDQRHGYGEYYWKDGRTYKGSFDKDQRHGHGQYVWPQGGAVYTGEFCRGLRQGKGEYKYEGGWYKGEFQRGLYHGYGECVWTDPRDARTYKGEWKDGKAHGYGVEKDGHTGKVLHDGQWIEDEPIINTNGQQQGQGGGQQQTTVTTKTMSKRKNNKKNNQQQQKQQENCHPLQADMTPVVNEPVVDAMGRKGIFRGMVLHGRIPHGVGHMEYDSKSERLVSEYQGFWNTGYWQEGRVDYCNGDTYHGLFDGQNQRAGKGEYHWQDGRQYSGEWKDDLRHGHGKFLYPNGDVFEGMFSDGHRHGMGSFVFHDGTIMEGGFVMGQLQGSGCKYVQKDGRVYWGEFTGGVRVGQGKELYPNGDLRYEGEWIDDAPMHPSKIQPAPEGFILKEETEEPEGTQDRFGGLRRGSMGSVNSLVQETQNCKTVVESPIHDAQGNLGSFTGLVLDGLPHGVGRMVYVGEIREGFWKHGYLEGHARAFFGNGDFYEGNFVQSQREGKGVYKWKDGRIYEGDYLNDLRHGHGRFVYPSGDEFVGRYEKGQRLGRGKFTFADGSSYDGEWKDSQYHGYGVLREVAGLTYKGEWKAGNRHGKGVEEFGSNLRKTGEWMDDELVADCNEDEDLLGLSDAAGVPPPPPPTSHLRRQASDSLEWGTLDGENKRWEAAADTTPQSVAKHIETAKVTEASYHEAASKGQDGESKQETGGGGGEEVGEVADAKKESGESDPKENDEGGGGELQNEEEPGPTTTKEPTNDEE